MIRGRFAPSPTGKMHLGNIRTALLAWLHARLQGGQFILRIEDIDLVRCRPEYEALILKDLRWLGLNWDEGPDVGGDFGPYRQSERSAFYEQALARLPTYPCSCTRRELQELQVQNGQEPVYPGVCREGVGDASRAQALRVRVSSNALKLQGTDVVRGELTQDVASEVGDFIVRRSDGLWAYQLAVVVDDGHMEVTEVVRGADLLWSMPRQIWLQQMLGYAHPLYCHVPLLVGEAGEKLSKRSRPPSISELREGGGSPGRVMAWLACSLGLVDADVRELSASELLGELDLGRLYDALFRARDWAKAPRSPWSL